jgi:hypothetical protein
MAKPRGWWTTHPTIMTVTVAGCWDSNGDGIGDFEGIRRHLGDLAEMGISGLRFQHVTRFDDDFEWFGLVAQDWFDVDPVYGTMADFERLMAECRARDVAVMVMAVPEYLGWRHPDYVAAREARAGGREDERIGWFGWEDDGSVSLTWNRPGPDLANPSYVEAYLEHVAFWMDRGISGWDVDAPTTWRNFNVDAVRAITGFIKARGGYVTSENLALENDIIRRGGFNAGTGLRRTQLYDELSAILDHDADYIRRGMDRHRRLIDHGMFPFQQFGDQVDERYGIPNLPWKLQMFRLQVAFNAALPDQVWVFANAIAFPNRPLQPLPSLNCVCWGQLDLPEIARQEADPHSPYRFFKRMMALRAREKALGIGDMQELPTDSRRSVFAALRTSEDGTERAVTVFNFGVQPGRVRVELGAGIGRLCNYLSGQEVRVGDEPLTLDLDRFGFKLFRVID